MTRPEPRHSSGPVTGVVAALREEVAPLLSGLGDPSSVPLRGGSSGDPPPLARRGRLDGVPVVVGVTGDGARRAREGIRIFLDAVEPDRLLVVGVSGALVEALEPHAMVLAREVWLGERRCGCPSEDELARAVDVTGLPRGVVVTVEDLLDTPGAKAEARSRLRRAGAEAGPAVADLESAHYVEAARDRDVPWIVLRAVSDTAEEGLPSFLNACRDDGGGLRRSSVARAALRHPTTMPELWRMRRRVGRCAEELAAAARVLTAGPGAAGGRPG